MWILIDLLLTAAIIRAVGQMTTTLVVDGWGSAMTATLGMMVLGLILAVPIGWLYTAALGAAFGTTVSVELAGGWPYALLDGGLRFAVTSVLLYVVALLTPGITVRGFWGVCVAALLITAVELVVPFLLTQSGLPF